MGFKCAQMNSWTLLMSASRSLSVVNAEMGMGRGSMGWLA